MKKWQITSPYPRQRESKRLFSSYSSAIAMTICQQEEWIEFSHLTPFSESRSFISGSLILGIGSFGNKKYRLHGA